MAFVQEILVDEVMDRMTDTEEKYRCIYLTRTKQLQSQLCADFPEAVKIEGKRNYPCNVREKDFPEFTAEDCPGGGRCTECHYFATKTRAKHEDPDQ